MDDYRQTLPAETHDDWEDDLTEEQRADILRRAELARNHPEPLEPWEGTAERLREQLRAYRGHKAAASRG